MLALATHIPPSVWAEEGQRTIVTAFDVLTDQVERAKDAAKGR